MSRIRVQPIEHRTLVEVVTGRLAGLILDGKLQVDEKLPAERELMAQLEVSRSTLREALRTLAENRLIEVRPGVGSFIRPLDRRNYAQAVVLAQARPSQPAPPSRPGANEHQSAPPAPIKPPPPGPGVVRDSSQPALRVPNLQTDRLGTFDFLSWWEREKVTAAKVMVVGAGALGNEVLKNLALMGVGHLFVVDFDTVEAANLSRSVLFREQDRRRHKAEVAAARVKELNPDVNVQYFQGDVTSQLGLGVFRRMDAVIGCLDNREARLAVNRYCYWMNVPWVDGAIQELLGLVRVFVPGQGACYECTLTEQARREMSLRYSCPLLARANLLQGKVPTTPTIAAIIGGLQSQEALKLIHGLPVESGHVVHFNGMTNQMHTARYVADPECESHWIYGQVVELPTGADDTTVESLVARAALDLGPEVVVELDQELVESLTCTACGTVDPVLRPIGQVDTQAAACPVCGELRSVAMTHQLTGQEPYSDRTLASLGVPRLHILRAHNGQDYRFYELSGDLERALHFRHFEAPRADSRGAAGIRLREPVVPDSRRAQGRIVLRPAEGAG